MATKDSKLMVFARLGTDWAPCGQLLLTEEGSNVVASSFAYGLNYARRVDAPLKAFRPAIHRRHTLPSYAPSMISVIVSPARTRMRWTFPFLLIPPPPRCRGALCSAV